MSLKSIVIVGAGHSGAKAAAAIRKRGWPGKLTLVGEEQVLPYDRPPLSKLVLLGKKSAEQCTFFPDSWYASQNIDLHLSTSAVHIDRNQGAVGLGDGQLISYDRLILATGAQVNELSIPGASSTNVLPLRTIQHSTAIALRLVAGSRVVIIGGGVIGLEVAAVAREKGCHVTVVERGSTLMTRSLPPQVSKAMQEVHRNEGVDFRFGHGLSSLVFTDDLATGVILDTDEHIPCDLVVYGIGVRPRTELAQKAGLDVRDGVLTSSRLATNDEHIFACGDVCEYRSERLGHHIRNENWRSAEIQATVAAANALGEKTVFDEIPWFWSNQYGLSLQVSGLPLQGAQVLKHRHDETSIWLTKDSNETLVGACVLGPALKVGKLMHLVRPRVGEPIKDVERIFQ